MDWGGEDEEGVEQNIVSRANGPMGGGEVKTEGAGHQVWLQMGEEGRMRLGS